MKKLFAALLVLALAFTGCAMAETLSVIAPPSPHAEIVRLIEEDLAAAGYELELIEVTDYVTENPAVAGGDVMINFFQHIPYLDGYNASVSEEEQLALLATDGMLVKRPLVIGDTFVLVGFREKEWLSLLSSK